MSAEDKAAQDAAREDLERRKANTSEYRFSGNAQINSHDVMYLSQTKLKNEARRKERETMLQNQRHSHSSESALLQATIVNPNIMPRQNSLPRNVKPPNLVSSNCTVVRQNGAFDILC